MTISISSTDLWNTSSVAKLAGGTLVGGVIAMVIVKYWRRSKRRKVYPHDTVIFHDVGRGLHVPALSPFSIKLKTYLRMAKIPYEVEYSWKASPKGKYPWIEYNSEAIGDTEFCIQFLNKEKEVDLNSHLTLEEKGIGRAFQKMLEENTYWILVLGRWKFDKTRGIETKIVSNWFVGKVLKHRLTNQAYCQGIGRHSEEEIYDIMRSDLTAVSNFLRSKRFLFGGRPCHYDCTVFGLLASFLWEPFGSKCRGIIQEFPNLCVYCETMKREFWSDWDKCTVEGQLQPQNNKHSTDSVQ